jgi:hypothetical protein
MDNGQAGVDGLLKTTLLTLGVPVERLRYRGRADAFITFQIITGQEAAFADDEGTDYEYHYGADIYSRGDYNTILQQTKLALKAAGFYGITVNAEIFEETTHFYHVPIDFYFHEEV